MINKIFLIVSLFCLLLYLFGILTSIINVEENDCKMTYMFEYPQFVRIGFRENDNFPKYGLYAYSEGHLTENARNMHFNGAPVLFIPGNGGSFKQARSLASVALRKGIDNDWIQHLDYFSVDLNGEYSGLFGGVLEDQTKFIALCIRKILDLYSKLPHPPKSLILVGHSMGGKIAQALARHPEVTNVINTIITLAAPMDKPVIAIDKHISEFYKSVENFWLEHRTMGHPVTNTTNYCKPYRLVNQNNTKSKIDPGKVGTEASENSTTKLLDEKLLITIGGGSRDLMVHPGLTKSKFSDIHAMATKVPGVWLTTDHLSSVWCLQLVMTINRFLYSIIQPVPAKKFQSKGQSFLEDKTLRLNKAKKYFDPTDIVADFKEVTLVQGTNLGDWVEDSRRVFTEQFKGFNRTRYQMIRLVDNPLHKFLRVEIINLETDDWVFGCTANEVTGMSRYCSKGISLTHLATLFPSQRGERTLLMLDLHKIKAKYPKWSHIILRFLPTNDAMKMIIDVHDPGNRRLELTMPKWYNYGTEKLLDDTVIGSSFYSLHLKGLEESYQALQLNVVPRSCSKTNHHAVARQCVPWTNGFDRYHFFTESRNGPMYIYAATDKPKNYNTTSIPVNIELHLDPSCRYKISIKNSLSMTMARLVQQYSYWIPAHLVSVMFLVVKNQITVTPDNEKFKCGSFIGAVIKCSPFFIITASRVFAKLILFFKFLPPPESYDLSLTVAFIIHGSAVAVLFIANAAAWGLICFYGNTAHKILFKIIHLPIPTISSTIVNIIEKLPMSAGAFLISLSMASCGGIGMLLAVLVYFILLTKMYEDYLEEFVFKTAKLIANKLFGGRRKTPRERAAAAETGQSNSGNLDDEANVEVPTDAVQVSRTVYKPPVDQAQEAIEDEVDDEEAETDQHLDNMLRESLERYKEQEAKHEAERKAARVEYDSILEGLSEIHFHLSLFFLLLISALLNLPSVITWAKNYGYSPLLQNDPTIYPSIAILCALCVIWQFPTPRNVIWYPYMSKIFYSLAVISILYCQESVWRLNYLIALFFILIAVHQVVAPPFKPKFNRDIFKDPRFQIGELEKMLSSNNKSKKKKSTNTALNPVTEENNMENGEASTDQVIDEENCENENQENDAHDDREKLDNSRNRVEESDEEPSDDDDDENSDSEASNDSDDSASDNQDSQDQRLSRSK